MSAKMFRVEVWHKVYRGENEVPPPGFGNISRIDTLPVGVISAFGMNQIAEMIARRSGVTYEREEFNCNGDVYYIDIGDFTIQYQYIAEKYRIPEVKTMVYNRFFREEE